MFAEKHQLHWIFVRELDIALSFQQILRAHYAVILSFNHPRQFSPEIPVFSFLFVFLKGQP